MRILKLLLGVTFLLSLSANVFLLLRRQPTQGGESLRHDPKPAHVTEMPSTLERAVPSSITPPPTRRPLSSLPPSTVEDYERELARLRAELAAAAKPTTPTAEQFTRGKRNPALEQLLKPELERILGSDDPKRWHTLECRDDICRLEVMTGRDDNNWMQELQSDAAYRKYVDSASFKMDKPPMSDALTGDWVTQNEALLRVGDPNRADGKVVLTELVRRFEASGAVRDCGTRFNDRGELEVVLSLGDDGAIGVVAGGPLAPRRGGRCIVDGLRATASATAVPRPVRRAMVNVKFAL